MTPLCFHKYSWLWEAEGRRGALFLGETCMKRSCLLKNRVFGKKGRKIYIKAQNARKTFKTAEFAVVEMPFGVESEKIERCGSDVRRWLAFLRENGRSAAIRRGVALRSSGAAPKPSGFARKSSGMEEIGRSRQAVPSLAQIFEKAPSRARVARAKRARKRIARGNFKRRKRGKSAKTRENLVNMAKSG